MSLQPLTRKTFYKAISKNTGFNDFKITKMELLGKGVNCFNTPEEAQNHFDEAYEKTLKWLQEASKEYIVSVKEAVTELKTGDMYEGLVAIADSYAGSPSFGKKDALKQVIKLCKKLLNE